jgi:Dolichyl-phosphate-mannose-protein mannosyltransferase
VTSVETENTPAVLIGTPPKPGPATSSRKTVSSFSSLLILACVMVVSAAYTGAHLRSGWVPADDGILGQSAMRVFNGQLPHRDFVEMYGGGLNYIHALFFRLFGVNLVSLRISVFLFFLTWIAAVFYICRRFVLPLSAGAVTLLAVVWTLPNYPAAMPSWYNLFFATFGAAALLHYLDGQAKRWLFLAGLCGGISILIKIIGAYYIAGVLLFLVLLEQQSQAADGQRPGCGSLVYRVFTFGSLGLFLTALVMVVRHELGAREIYHFVLPSAVIVALILLRERYVGGAESSRRFVHLFQTLLPFVAGVTLPILLFLIPYILSGSVHTVLGGVSSSSAGRAVALAVVRPLPLDKILFAVPLAALMVLSVYCQGTKKRMIVLSIGLAVALLVLACKLYINLPGKLWFTVGTLTPLVILIGAVMLLVDSKKLVFSDLRQKQMLLFLPLAALCSLVQFPFPVPIYFCYAAPLTLFAFVAIVAQCRGRSAGYAFAPIVVFYIFVAVQYVVPSYIYELTHKVGAMRVLRLPRGGGIKMEYADGWEQLIKLLQQHSPNGLMWAGNNCAELYFLSGLANPLPDDGGASPDEILKAIQSDDLKLVVLNQAPFFPSALPDPHVVAEVTRKFPHFARAGGFLVFWRE